jgi:hypothetical protein
MQVGAGCAIYDYQEKVPDTTPIEKIGRIGF